MLLLLFCGCSFLCSKCSSVVIRTAEAKVTMHGHTICSVLQMKTLKVCIARKAMRTLVLKVQRQFGTKYQHCQDNEHKPCCTPVLKDLEKSLKALNELKRHKSPPQNYRKLKL